MPQEIPVQLDQLAAQDQLVLQVSKEQQVTQGALQVPLVYKVI